MSIFLFANNATSTIQGALAIDGTEITVASGTGSLFSEPVDGVSVFRATLSNSTGTLLEIVECILRSGDVMTIMRAQEGTTALAWPSGTLIKQLLTAGQADAFLQTTGGPLFYPSRQITSDGQTTITSTDVGLLVNKTSITTFLIPAPTGSGRFLIFKDYAGNCSTFNITLDAGAGKFINGQQTLVMNGNYSTTMLIDMSSTKWGTLI